MRVPWQQTIRPTDGRSPKTRRTQLTQEPRLPSDATTGPKYGYNSVQEMGSATNAICQNVLLFFWLSTIAGSLQMAVNSHPRRSMPGPMRMA